MKRRVVGRDPKDSTRKMSAEDRDEMKSDIESCLRMPNMAFLRPSDQIFHPSKLKERLFTSTI